MAAGKKRWILVNKFLSSVIITLFVLVLTSMVSREYFPVIRIPNFLGVMMQDSNLGIKNIFLSRFTTNRVANKNVVVVEIDNTTLSDKKGLWRWQDFKRSYYASVIDNLKRDGAIVIGIDVLFSEKSNSGDDVLAKSMERAGNVVLGFWASVETDGRKESLFPINELKEKSAALGYFDPRLNPNNSIAYSVEPMGIIDNSFYESFSLAVLRKYLDIITGETTVINRENRQYEGYYKFHSGKYEYIPYATEESAELFIHYLPVSSHFSSLSFVDVYNGNYDKSIVENKIVLIGATATALHDEFFTPVGIQSWVLVHANMINTILNNAFINHVGKWSEVFFLALLTFLLTLFILHVDNRVYQLGFSVISLILFGFFQIVIFIFFHKLFNYPAQLFFIIIMVGLFVTGYKYIYEEKGKRLLKNTLSQYLAEDLVLSVLHNYEEVQLGGSRKEITSFFSDIKGFTTISENMEPEELVKFLSVYLKEVSDIIIQNKGFINKYEGDAVMALWWAFGYENRQTYLACKSALEQQKKINEMNVYFEQNYGVKIAVRMGINKGPAVVWNIGSQGKKIEYTALGDSVNTASRLEGINKLYGTLICVGENVANDAKDHFIFRKLDFIQVKGKEKPLTIYELVWEKEKVTADEISHIREYEKGLDLYLQKNFEEAKTIFKKLSEAIKDAPSAVFLARSEDFIKSGVDENWNGSYRAKEK